MKAAEPHSGGAIPHLHLERDRGVYRIDSIDGLAHVVVEVGREDDRSTRISRVFRTLGDAEIPVFLIKLHGSAVTFAVEARHVGSVESALSGIAVDCSSR